MNCSRREVLCLPLAPLLTAFVASCSRESSLITPTPVLPTLPPTDNKAQPFPQITVPGGGSAVLKYYGYANQDEPLLDALNRGNFSPRESRQYPGLIDSLIGYSPTWGWLFYVRNGFFGTAVGQEPLKTGSLWAVYEKQTKG